MKKTLAILLALTIILSTGTSLAAFSDVSEVSYFYDAIQRVTSLGIMDALEGTEFKHDEAVTRAQFAQAIVISAGLWSTAEKMKGITRFSDVPYDGPYNGYINVCVKEGYMTGVASSRFGPDSPVTLAQAVTAMIRVLGYKDADLLGMWPKNYMEKAKALGLTEGLPDRMSLTADSVVSRSFMAQMFSNLLDTQIKSADAKNDTLTLAEASGLTAGSIYTVYSKPEAFLRSKFSGTKIGGIDLGGGVSIVKNSVDNSIEPAAVTNGEAINIDDIEEYDIVYQISDRTGRNRYILVIENRITGVVTGILPDKFQPEKIEINGKAYELDKSFDRTKLTGTDSFRLNDTVTVLLGRDGKAVDILGTVYEDNSNFALVINYMKPSSNQYVSNGSKRTVKLMLTDGTVKTFDAASDPSELKGKLVKYTKNEDGTVTLTSLNYVYQSEMKIDKANKRILYSNDYYSNDVADNVKIFNIISLNNDKDNDEDTKAEMLNWSEMPSGMVKTGKILYLNKAGMFDDINIILLNDIETADVRLGIVKGYKGRSADGKQYNYSIVIGGKEYMYSTDAYNSALVVDTAVKVRLSGNTVSEVIETVEPDTSATFIQAADTERIRLNSRTYKFADNCTVYLLKSPAIPEKIKLSDLWTETVSGQFRIYTDTSLANGGKVEMIIIKGY